MNLTDINRKQIGRWLEFEQHQQLTATEQYLHNYFDAAFRALSTFEYARLSQADIVASGNLTTSIYVASNVYVLRS